MRVKFGKRIYFCTLATKSTNSAYLLITTNNGVYVVNCGTEDNANDCHRQLLRNGYCDFSDYEYDN